MCVCKFMLLTFFLSITPYSVCSREICIELLNNENCTHKHTQKWVNIHCAMQINEQLKQKNDII